MNRVKAKRVSAAAAALLSAVMALTACGSYDIPADKLYSKFAIAANNINRAKGKRVLASDDALAYDIRLLDDGDSYFYLIADSEGNYPFDPLNGGGIPGAADPNGSGDPSGSGNGSGSESVPGGDNVPGNDNNLPGGEASPGGENDPDAVGSGVTVITDEDGNLVEVLLPGDDENSGSGGAVTTVPGDAPGGSGEGASGSGQSGFAGTGGSNGSGGSAVTTTKTSGSSGSQTGNGGKTVSTSAATTRVSVTQSSAAKTTTTTTKASSKASTTTTKASTTTTKSTASTTTPSGDVSKYLTAEVKELLSFINAERTKAGVAQLTLNAKLCEAANVRVAEIQTEFGHVRPNGQESGDYIRQVMGGKGMAVENIAYNYDTAEDVMYFYDNRTGLPDEEMAHGWMNTYLTNGNHKKNLLSAYYDQVGLAFYEPTHSWVALFYSTKYQSSNA